MVLVTLEINQIQNEGKPALISIDLSLAYSKPRFLFKSLKVCYRKQQFIKSVTKWIQKSIENLNRVNISIIKIYIYYW